MWWCSRKRCILRRHAPLSTSNLKNLRTASWKPKTSLVVVVVVGGGGEGGGARTQPDDYISRGRARMKRHRCAAWSAEHVERREIAARI